MPELTAEEAVAVAITMATELYTPELTQRKRVIALGNKLSAIINSSRTDQVERSCAVIGLLAQNCVEGPNAQVMQAMVAIVSEIATCPRSRLLEAACFCAGWRRWEGRRWGDDGIRMVCLGSRAHRRSCPKVAAMMLLKTRSRPLVKRPRREVDRDYLEWLAEKPCAACGRRPVTIHHLRCQGSTAAAGRRSGDGEAVMLCHEHHQGNSGVHRLSEAVFWPAWGIDPLKRVAALRAEYEASR